MNFDDLHSWDLTPKAAVALQRDLAQRLVDHVPLDLQQVRTVAGVDVGVRGGLSRAAVVVMRLPQLDIIETACAEADTHFPYIPGLLAFREGPVVLAAIRRLLCEPDAFLFDGMGQIHPRRMGIAAHLGLWLGRPTIGCGKSHYIGDYQPPAESKGAHSQLTHRGEALGVVLRTRARVKPIYVSVGHLADIQSAVELTLRCTTRFRLPEPIRAAHKAAAIQPG